jgi:copper chaperone NosL
MVVAITGKRRFLFYYLVLTIIGGILAMIDFYKWGYDYGHDLDPSAPIQVPGLSYQPPLFGHKRLLNFDAYSFPDVGGWIVIAAGALAFAVWFVEWNRQRKAKKDVRPIANAAMAAGLLVFFISSCSNKPQPFNYGKDICDNCKMTIIDPKFGGEIITKKGKIYKFDDAACMIHFLKSGSVKEDDISQKLVINFQQQNDFIDVNNAFLLISAELKTPMGGNAAAFASQEEALKLKNTAAGEIMRWNDVLNKSE